MNTPKQKSLFSNRLTIPNAIVKASGFLRGETACVLDEDPSGAVEKPCLVLLKEKPVNPVGKYAVQNAYRIGVTAAVLKRCGLDGTRFQIDGKDGKIIVRMPSSEAAASAPPEPIDSRG